MQMRTLVTIVLVFAAGAFVGWQLAYEHSVYVNDD